MADEKQTKIANWDRLLLGHDPGWGDALVYGYGMKFKEYSDSISVAAADLRETMRTPLRELRMPLRAGKTAALRQSAAMQAMAGVMGQVEKVAGLVRVEDWLLCESAQDRRDPFGVRSFYLRDAANRMPDGWRDRAASRWSAQVRAKVKERDEARRADVAVRCQGEED